MGEPCEEMACAAYHSYHITQSIFNLWAFLPHSGGFLGGCVHHCEDSRVGDVEHIRPIRGDTPLQALAKWYNSNVRGRNPTKNRFWYQNSSFPCIECCPPGEEGIRRHMLHGLE